VNLRITYVGHATTLIELGEARLLTDPILRDRLLHIRRHGPGPGPEIAAGLDAVLISHLHPDHLDFPSLRALGRETAIVVPSGGAGMLRRRRFGNVIEAAAGDSIGVGGVDIVATHAIHDGRRLPLGRPVDALGYEIHAGGQGVYFAGDTDLFDAMAEMAGRIDVALLPIGGWGPRLRGRHLSPRTAAEAAAMIRPRIAIPIHWGSLFRIGLLRRRPELASEPGREFAAQLARRAPDVEARVLAPGESLDVAAAATRVGDSSRRSGTAPRR